MPEGNNSPDNWVDPDIITYYEENGGMPAFDPERERAFKEFFETGWSDPNYDDLRSKWNPFIYDTDPHGRVLAKTALWSLVGLREAQEKVRLRPSKMAQRE